MRPILPRPVTLLALLRISASAPDARAAPAAAMRGEKRPTVAFFTAVDAFIATQTHLAAR